MNFKQYLSYIEKVNGKLPEFQRRGQNAYNVLYALDARLCSKIEMIVDPFYVDDKLPAFLKELRKHVTISEIDENVNELISFYNLDITWEDEFSTGHGTFVHMPKMAHWSMSWEHGVIGLSFVDEKYSKLEAVTFAHLFTKGIDVSLALELARSYVSNIQLREKT